MNDFISAPRRLAAAGLCLSAALTPAYAAEPLKVVASFPSWATSCARSAERM